MRYRVVALVFLAGMLLAPAARAEGFYLGGGAGRIDFDLAGEAGRFGLDGTAYKLHAGFGVKRWLGFEAQYAVLDGAEASAGSATAEVDLGLLSVYGRFVGRFSPRLELFAKVGATRWEADTAIRIDGVGDGTASSSGTSFSYGAGVGYFVTERFSLRLDFDTFGDLDDAENVKMISGAVQYTF